MVLIFFVEKRFYVKLFVFLLFFVSYFFYYNILVYRYYKGMGKFLGYDNDNDYGLFLLWFILWFLVLIG